MDSLMSKKADLILGPEGDGEPVKGTEDGCDMIIFPHSHQDPSSAVLYVLEPLKALARDPDEKCVTVVQPGGNKGVDEPLSIWQGECRAESGDIPEVVE